MAARSALQTERASREAMIRSGFQSRDREIELLKEDIDLKTEETEVVLRDFRDTQRDLKDAEKSIDILREELEQLKQEREREREAKTVPSLETYFSLKGDGEEIPISELQELGKMAELTYLQELNQHLRMHWTSLYGKTVFISPEGDISHVVEGDISELSIRDLHDQYEEKLQFYDQQLEDSEMTLMSAKTAWHATNQILQDQIRHMEEEMAALKVEVASRVQEREMNEREEARSKRHVEKAKQKVEKMSEYMNRCEVQLVHKKVELANAVDALNTLEFECHALRDAVKLYEEREKGKGVVRATSLSCPSSPSSPSSSSGISGSKGSEIDAIQKAKELVNKTKTNAPSAGLTSGSFSKE